ncbi:unnamed protein product [Amoebophrya sp. A25]|nr:unnamed protein product [Amoebophrya sp. A25]|eukprot:GSA25T00016093001.1
MACVVGPTDAGMAKFDKGNITKVFRVWAERIDKELQINVSNDRSFRVGHTPALLPEKVNRWDPREQKVEDPHELTQSVKFKYPPIEEITDIKYVGVQAFPRERFGIPQSEYHKIGWMSTPAEFRTKFAKDLLEDKTKTCTTFNTGQVNMRDKFWRNQQRPKVKNPMAHHTGYITGLADNPYERTIKHPEKLPPTDPLTQEWKKMKRKDRRDRKKMEREMIESGELTATTLELGGGATSSSSMRGTTKVPKKVTDPMAEILAECSDVDAVSVAKTPSILSSNATDMVKARSMEELFRRKTENCQRMLLNRYAQWQRLGQSKRWFHPQKNSDVTTFADEYTKQMLTGPHMKTQPLVSR